MGKTIPKEAQEDLYSGLLLRWCDRIMDLQEQNGDPTLFGGILCPACGMIHGRCHEAVYPLMCAARRTKSAKYVNAARAVFRWGKNMLRADGGTANDAKSEWEGVTAFAALSLNDAVERHGDLLPKEEREEWAARVRVLGRWVYEHLAKDRTAHINYLAAAAAVLETLGKKYRKTDYLAAADDLAEYCFGHMSGNGLICGEGAPHDARSEKGCRPVDIGYLAEETLPCLVRWALAKGSDTALERCETAGRAVLQWMLPDGAWDCSTGTRAFKWAYWGSRTADGCQEAFTVLGRRDPVFAEAALRNTLLMNECTRGGLLAGGPDYEKAGEPICVHHTFCRAKTLAAALDAGLYDFERQPLPAESAPALRYYAEMDAYRARQGEWRMDVTGSDMITNRNGLPTGGALTLLYHRKLGAVVAAGCAEYVLHEPMNLQLPRDAFRHRSPCPRTEGTKQGVRYATVFDRAAELHGLAANDGTAVTADARLCDISGAPTDGDNTVHTVYTLTPAGLRISVQIPKDAVNGVAFILPAKAKGLQIGVNRGFMYSHAWDRFCLTPGVVFSEYRFRADEEGRIEVEISENGV